MTPSLPTLSTASAIVSPICGSAAEMAPTLAICGLVVDLLGLVLDRLDGELGRALDAALQAHRVGAGRDVAQAFLHDRLGEHRGRRRAVTGDVVGLLRDLLDQLGADLLLGVVELDLLGDRDAVVRDRGGAPLLLEDHVAALRAERDLHGVGELVHAPLERAPCVLIERDDLRCHPFSFPGPWARWWSVGSQAGLPTASTRGCRVLTIVAANRVWVASLPPARAHRCVGYPTRDQASFGGRLARATPPRTGGA